MREYMLTIFRDDDSKERTVLMAESPVQAFEMASSVAGDCSWDLVPAVHHEESKTVH